MDGLGWSGDGSCCWSVIHLVFYMISTYRMQVLITTIAVPLQGRPEAASDIENWESDYKIVGTPSFVKALTAVASTIFAYAGTPGKFSSFNRCASWPFLTPCPGFFPIAAEMRDPSQYTRSLIGCQLVVTSIYLSIGTVIYIYCGSYVSSPALGSAGTLIKKISYGIALPGLVVSTVMVLHVSDVIQEHRPNPC